MAGVGLSGANVEGGVDNFIRTERSCGVEKTRILSLDHVAVSGFALHHFTSIAKLLTHEGSVSALFWLGKAAVGFGGVPKIPNVASKPRRALCISHASADDENNRPRDRMRGDSRYGRIDA